MKNKQLATDTGNGSVLTSSDDNQEAHERWLAFAFALGMISYFSLFSHSTNDSVAFALHTPNIHTVNALR